MALGTGMVNGAANGKVDACKNGGADKSPVQNGENAVSVIVRVRPLSTVEHADPSIRSVIQSLNDGVLVHGVSTRPPSRYFGARNAMPQPQYFKFDKVFHPHSTQIEVYNACRNVVVGVFEGINGSVLAYGATGSGKTHTMFGGKMSVAGVVYQAIQEILEEKERLEIEEQKVVTLRCSFLEVYNEDVFDLLTDSSPNEKRVPLKVQDFGYEDDMSNAGKNGVNPETLTVRGLTRASPQTAEDFAKLVERGHVNRFVASTNANEESSRSHAILTVEVEVKDTVDAFRGTVGRICFCDLAGSERAAGTTNSGIRLHEGGNINRSLLALGAVVQALAQRRRNQRGRASYIPYRGSKLTRLLRDCLGGNCRTLMMFCVSPSCAHYEETINTMLFAMQAKEIQVSARRHEFRVDSKEVAKNQETLIEELRLELAQARDELLRMRGGSPQCMLNRSALPQSSSPAHLGPSAGFLTPMKADSPPIMSLRAAAAESECLGDAHGESSPCPVHFSFRTSTRLTQVGGEGSETYIALQNKLKTICVEKETLYRRMREAEEAHSELDIRLRQHKWKLARFLSTRRNTISADSNGEKITPVGVAGLRLAIEKMELESVAQGGKMERLLAKMNETDRTIAEIRQELLREKQHPLLELLLDNVKLRQSSTEAECLAAHYHQQCRCMTNREEEYAQALSICASVVHLMLPLVSNSPEMRMEAQLALMFANLPSLSTIDMISVFERSMKTGHPPSTCLLDSSRAFHSLETVEERLQRLVKDNEGQKKSISREPQPLHPPRRRSVPQVKTTTSTVHVGKSTGAKKNRLPPPSKGRRPGPEPFVASYSTLSLRTMRENKSTSTNKPVMFNRTPSTNGKAVSFAVEGRKKIASGPAAPHLPPRAGTKTVAAAKVTSKFQRVATAPMVFHRLHTASEAIQQSRPHGSKYNSNNKNKNNNNNNSKQDRARKLRISPSIQSSPQKKAGQSRKGHEKPPTVGTEKASCKSPKPLESTDLVERFTRLLTEVQQWHHNSAAAAATKTNHTAYQRVG